jgi:hypothetical protein
MSSSLFECGLKISKIDSGCLFSMNLLKCKFGESDLYMIFYTENFKTHSIITDGEKWVNSPVTIRLNLGIENEDHERFFNVINEAFLKPI